MMERFNGLTPREKIMVIVMMALIAVFILWSFIFAPLGRFHAGAQQAQIKAQNDRVFIENNIGRIGKGAGLQGSEPFSRTALLEMSRQAGIERFSRIQPQPNGDIKVWIDDVPTPRLYSFMQKIEAQYATRVTGAQISRQDGGVVSAQISFAMPAGGG